MELIGRNEGPGPTSESTVLPLTVMLQETADALGHRTEVLVLDLLHHRLDAAVDVADPLCGDRVAVRGFPARLACVELPWKTLLAAPAR